jgi:hypothetical protein
MLVMHLIATPPPLHELVADVPAHVEAAIMHGLARAREDRYDGIPAFVEALLGIMPRGAPVLFQPELVKALSVAMATTEVPAAKIAVLPSATTFSRTTGEVRATDDDDLLPTSKRPRRWLPITMGCTAVAAIGILVLALARPSRDRLPSSVTLPSLGVAAVGDDGAR